MNESEATKLVQEAIERVDLRWREDLVSINKQLAEANSKVRDLEQHIIALTACLKQQDDSKKRRDDSDQHPSWIAQLHDLCTTFNIPSGHISGRLEILRGQLAIIKAEDIRRSQPQPWN